MDLVTFAQLRKSATIARMEKPVALRGATRYCPINSRIGRTIMAETKPNYSTPSVARSVIFYFARRGFKQGLVDPSLDHVIGVEDAIDIH